MHRKPRAARQGIRNLRSCYCFDSYDYFAFASQSGAAEFASSCSEVYMEKEIYLKNNVPRRTKK